MATKLIKTSALGNFKFVMIPLFTLVAVIGVGAFAYTFSSSKIKVQLKDIAQNEKEISVLGNKVAVLQEEQDLLRLYEPQAMEVLPNANPVLFQLYSLRLLANETATTIEDIKIGAVAESEGDVSSVAFSFSATGSMDSILNLIDVMRLRAPLFNISKVKIEGDDNAATAEITASSFYSELPSNLPPITSPVTKITREELEAFSRFEIGGVDSSFGVEPVRGDPSRNPFVF